MTYLLLALAMTTQNTWADDPPKQGRFQAVVVPQDIDPVRPFDSKAFQVKTPTLNVKVVPTGPTPDYVRELLSREGIDGLVETNGTFAGDLTLEQLQKLKQHGYVLRVVIVGDNEQTGNPFDGTQRIDVLAKVRNEEHHSEPVRPSPRPEPHNPSPQPLPVPTPPKLTAACGTAERACLCGTLCQYNRPCVANCPGHRHGTFGAATADDPYYPGWGPHVVKASPPVEDRDWYELSAPNQGYWAYGRKDAQGRIVTEFHAFGRNGEVKPGPAPTVLVRTTAPTFPAQGAFGSYASSCPNGQCSQPQGIFGGFR